MTAASFTLDFTDPAPAGRECCDLCGDWHTELRLEDCDGWTADTFICRACFGTDDGPDFTDLPLVQEAIKHV